MPPLVHCDTDGLFALDDGLHALYESLLEWTVGKKKFGNKQWVLHVFTESIHVCLVKFELNILNFCENNIKS